MGPTALMAEDFARERLVAPFSGPLLPARSYCTYVRENKEADKPTSNFLSWIEQEGNILDLKG